MMYKIHAIIVIVAIMLCYIYATWNTGRQEEYFYGFWIADQDDFCEQTEIESMLIFIGEPTTGWTGTSSRTCHIVINNDLTDQGFTLTYRPGWSSASLGKYALSADIAFDTEQLWPENITIEIDMQTGEMRIHRDEVLYARVVKQHDITNAARTMNSAETI
jgi:hypothetical protein